MQVDGSLQARPVRPPVDRSAQEGPQQAQSLGVHVQRRKINKVDELFEALMALIDAAQGQPHDPEDNKLLVEQAVQDGGHVLSQRVVG